MMRRGLAFASFPELSPFSLVIYHMISYHHIYHHISVLFEIICIIISPRALLACLVDNIRLLLITYYSELSTCYNNFIPIVDVGKRGEY